MRRLRRLPRVNRSSISKLETLEKWRIISPKFFFCENFLEKTRKNKSVNAGLLNKKTNGDILHLEENI